MAHADLADERERLAWAASCLDAMRERTRALASRDDLAANLADAVAVQHQLKLRLQSLEAEGATLCFGRIDEEPIGRSARERHYIGRRHIEDADGAPVVIDWRAAAAIPFYRATAIDPFGLSQRRRFTFALDELVDLYDEDFNDPDSLISRGAGVPDPLLAELARARTGQMRDIVATIAAEQDEVIRAPLGACLIVQGGPGTGKTAVALHRAAYLLFEHRQELARRGVLVIGPNQVFLEYIARVLPSLGETSVMQTTVDQLLGLRFRVIATDEPAAAAIKGDARMAAVIARAVESAITPPLAPVRFVFRARSIELSVADIQDAIGAARVSAARADVELIPIGRQRDRFRERVVRVIYDRWTGGEPRGLEPGELAAELLRATENRTALDAIWKPTNAVNVIRRLLTNRRALAGFADGLLTSDEQGLIWRPSPPKGAADPWTTADLALIDEAEALVRGEHRIWGHVIVDEAQDCSPMVMRMIARRSHRASLTIVGDLAQATAPAAAQAWSSVITHLGDPQNVELRELTVGYRLPARVLDFANALLAEAAPAVTPARSVREAGEPPLVLSVAPTDVVATVVAQVEQRSPEMLTTAVIAPDHVRDAIERMLVELGVVTGAVERGAGIADRVSVLAPATAKGLEFDSVIVAEPAEIARDVGGVRLLFVALTRAVQQLTLVHSQPLPKALQLALEEMTNSGASTTEDVLR